MSNTTNYHLSQIYQYTLQEYKFYFLQFKSFFAISYEWREIAILFMIWYIKLLLLISYIRVTLCNFAAALIRLLNLLKTFHRWVWKISRLWRKQWVLKIMSEMSYVSAVWRIRFRIQCTRRPSEYLWRFLD